MKKLLYRIVIVALLAVFAYSAYSLVAYYMDSHENEQAYENLAQMLVDRPTVPLPLTPGSETVPAQTQPEQELVTVQNPQTGETLQILPEYAQLYSLNPDLVGWISIDGTNINYPVVQSDSDHANYYLNRNFLKESSVHGCIYAIEVADVFAPSDNVILYGHRMADHSMFGQLGYYTEEDFWQQYPYIRFDTLQERHLYQIICVFSTSAYAGEGFAYHSFIDAADPSDFDAYISQCRALSYYDTGITAAFGDKLITLSTCEYTHANGRLVIVAKRIA